MSDVDTSELQRGAAMPVARAALKQPQPLPGQILTL